MTAWLHTLIPLAKVGAPPEAAYRYLLIFLQASQAFSAGSPDITAAHGLAPVLPIVEPLPGEPVPPDESGEIAGTEAVELNVELLLPALGQEVPDATVGDVAPEPAGFTPEHARLGTIAGIIEISAEVPVLEPVLGTLLDAPGDVVDAVPAVVALPGVTVGAMGMVMGAGKSPVATPAGPPVSELSTVGAGGGDKDTAGVSVSAAPPPDDGDVPSALLTGDTLLFVLLLPAPVVELPCALLWHPKRMSKENTAMPHMNMYCQPRICQDIPASMQT